MNTVRRNLLCSALAVAIGICGTATSAHAQEASERKSFDVPAQPAASALNAFAEQADITLVFSQDLVAGLTTRPLQGVYTTTDALQTLLAETGLAIQRVNDSTISIGAGTSAGVAGRQAAPQGGERPQELGAVTVTGTRIRGGTTPSPVITIGTEHIREEGFSDLGDVIRTIPQNFSGGQNPEVGSGGLSGAGAVNRNITGGSSLNLRGLGPDATLTLLNGRRLSHGGTVQAVDISAIPVEAVDRIEIVADGASAIYGSDAVGGVGNVVLKRDFDGVAIGMLHGAATDGGLNTREYVGTAGTLWESGGLIATMKDSSVDPIYADRRHYTRHLVPPTTIYPGSKLRSGLISGHQSLGDRVELRLDALRTTRDQLYYYEYFGTNRTTGRTTTSIVSPTVEFLLARDWSLTLGGSWSRDRSNAYQTLEDAATGVVEVVGDSCFCNQLRNYEIGAEGSLFAMGGGDARLAVGAGYRWSDFRVFDHAAGANTVEGEESSRFAYAELALPLVGPGQQVANVRRLELTAAVRGEDYDTFGGVVTPKLGLIYAPSGDVTLKASWGRAFKAPTLNERYRDSVAYLLPPSYVGGSGYADGAAALYVGGGNPELTPERARTWAATLAFHPEVLPGLTAEVTYFDIHYRDRVVEPIRDLSQAMSNPNYEGLIDHAPSADAQARALASIDHFFNFIGVAYDPERVVALIHGRRANVAEQRISGLDLSGAYRFDLGPGQMTVRGSASWLDSTQQNLAGQSFYDLSGTLFNPAEHRSRIGAVWRQGGFSASAFASHTAGVTDVKNARRTASFTTFDTTLRYETGDGIGAWSGLDIALSARNLFNRAPPLHVPELPLYAAPYDGTNYSAVGRYLSLSISKRF